MNKKRVLLLTGTTDEGKGVWNHFTSKEDNYMEEVFELTLPSKNRYVKKHGYDLLSLRSFGEDKQNRFKRDEVGALRVLRTYEMLQYYDVVMWIDADAIITNDEYTIDDFLLDDQHCFYASWDWNGKFSMSTGNFIIQNTENLAYFFDVFCQIYGQFNCEQPAINAMYRGDNNSRNIIKILEHQYLNSVPSKETYAEAWATRPPVFAPWTKDSFLSHLTGVSNKKRIELLKNYYGQYL
jgi:hypothetical protein